MRVRAFWMIVCDSSSPIFSLVGKDREEKDGIYLFLRDSPAGWDCSSRRTPKGQFPPKRLARACFGESVNVSLTIYSPKEDFGGMLRLKVSRCNREVPGELKGAALFWRGKAAFFAGGEAGGGVTVPVEILEKMPKGRGESGRGIRGNAEFLKKRCFFIKGIPSGRDFGV